MDNSSASKHWVKRNVQMLTFMDKQLRRGLALTNEV
jgi:hypothetical protein